MVTLEKENERARMRTEKIKLWLLSHPPTICSERAVTVTDAYRKSEGQPAVLRRAGAFASVLSDMSIYIGPCDLLVGGLAGAPRRAPLYPEFSWDWIEEELDKFDLRSGDRFLVSPTDKEHIRGLLPYWKGRSLKDHVEPLIPAPSLAALLDKLYTVPCGVNQGNGHITVDYGKVLQEGLASVAAEAEARLHALDLTDPDQFQQRFFLEAVTTTCRAVIRLANRYADLAQVMAARELDLQRKKELEAIAANCRRVPEHPAGSFYEALQSFWFVQLTMQIESNGLSYSPGRFDQYMHPFYLRSIDEGSLTQENAQELLDCLWLKFNEITRVKDITSTKQAGGMPLYQNLIVGGQTVDGDDATNELSYMCMEATAHVHMPQPSFSIRYHRRTPEPFLIRACEIVRLGTGLPAMYNDEVIIPALLNRGISLGDARSYCIVGCVEPSVPARTQGEHGASKVNLAKCFELTVNNGVCPNCGSQLGPPTGDPEDFACFEQFMEAYRGQVRSAVRLMVEGEHAISMATPRIVPVPFVSALVQDCIGRGKDVTEGGAEYNFVSPEGIGLGTAADALAAVKSQIYDESRVTWPQLKAALKANFEEMETLRQLLIGAPKYGNDIDWVDLLARDVGQTYCREVEKYSVMRGGKFQPGLYPATAHVPMGAMVGATADGRKAAAPLSEGVSPSQGRDTTGPTAMMKSVAKLDHVLASNGTLLNIKFHPSMLKEERDLRKMADLIRGYFLLGGMHIQLNVISTETLRAAQREPEKYRDLVVRVAGYSAFFTVLEKGLQDDIISRTEHVVA